MKTREKTTKKLQKLGFTVLPSKANFIFITREGLDGQQLYETLKEQGILIRHFSKKAICQYNRVTIGTEEEMEAFLEAVTQIVRR
jgi:histidinol-phosphate aminotransferase